MLTISALARQFGLSRSTLLYYDRLGLQCPSGRSCADYRLYSEADQARLARITTLRTAGMPLAQIASLLGGGDNDPASHELEAHLAVLNARQAELLRQQRQVLTLLGRTGHDTSKPMDKAQWTALLRSGGMDENGMHQFHITFESTNPAGHQDFLTSLGLDAAEVAKIRERSRESPSR
jgi:MerR family transcriptional regulator, thiopeptide resistance regulator